MVLDIVLPESCPDKFILAHGTMDRYVFENFATPGRFYFLLKEREIFQEKHIQIRYSEPTQP